MFVRGSVVINSLATLALVGAIASARPERPSEHTDIIVYEHAPDALAPWPVLDIYLLDAQGTKSHALTNDGHSHNPSWSGDGQRILFIHDIAAPGKWQESSESDSHHSIELYVMNRDGSNSHLLRRFEAPILQAAWSPDNKWIGATYSTKEWEDTSKPGNQPTPPAVGLFLLPADTPGTPRLLFKEAYTAAWSPDGMRLAFSARLPNNHWAVHVANVDGSREVQLTDPSINGGSPAWSPDGRHIAFDATLDGHDQIFVMDENGSEQHPLTTDYNWDCHAPSWSPDGERIAFYCSPISSPCRAGNAGPNSDENRCVRRVFVMEVFAPKATPVQLTKEDGAFPVNCGLRSRKLGKRFRFRRKSAAATH
jgi:Tol biopolymer transport system component